MNNVNRFSMLGGNPAAEALTIALSEAGGVHELRDLSPLPDEAQRVIDETVVSVGMERLTIAADLMAANLTFNVDDPMSVIEVYWEKVSRVGKAYRTMEPHSRGENQLQDREGIRTPLYATMDDFNFSARLLGASRRGGAALDTSHIAQATRNVNEAIEDALINGGPTVAGVATPGLLQVGNEYPYVDAQAWTNAGHDGSDILADVQGMAALAVADGYYGPFNLYVPTLYDAKLDGNFIAGSDLTIRERLQKLNYGGRPLVVKPADLLPADTTVLVPMQSSSVDMIIGQQPIAVNWSSPDGFWRYFAVLAFIVHRVKEDYDNKTGIVVGKPTFPE